MCGILGILAAQGSTSAQTPLPWLDDRAAANARDTMVHRGPDDAGLVRSHTRTGAGVVLGHRRLAVVDPSPLGHQPMCLERPDGSRRWLVYNGELYNDHQLRMDLRTPMHATGQSFKGTCDAETLLHAIEAWGEDALPRLRGMYAFASIDTRTGELLLARDPLGIKPLYVHFGRLQGDPALVFASEIPAILAIPGVQCAPDWVTVSAYLTTIRTTLGARTMFAGIETLEPGEHRCYTATAETLRQTRRAIDPIQTDNSLTASDLSASGLGAAEDLIRDAVRDSVRAHLRADVPMCALLSGGLDSSVIAYETMHAVGSLSTYCSGSREIESIDGVAQSDDFHFASEVGKALKTKHTEVPISGTGFLERWAWMVRQLGVPLSTPNEVAIYEVASALRGDGQIVALSGEGADELFAGYAGPMLHAARHAEAVLAGSVEGVRADGGLCELTGSSWTPLDTKAALFTPSIMELSGADVALCEWYTKHFAAQLETVSDRDDPLERRLEAHLRFQQRVNLTGLLGRLDTSTMLASVEGRTPFADVRIAEIAMGSPMRLKCLGLAAGATSGDLETKRVLRGAYRGVLPKAVVGRPKASFPMPFQHWMGSVVAQLSTGVARDVFTAEAAAFVQADPSKAWRFAWPMINIAMWLERWWGSGSVTESMVKPEDLCVAQMD